MEIASAIGGALLAPAFESLFNKLASKDLLNYAREGHVLTEINKWKEMLESICGVLEDAEEKQTVSKPVKMWVRQLRNLAYDLEDILDEFDFEARRSKLKAEPVAGSSKVRKLFHNIRAVKFNKEMISKIKGISSRLEDITSRRNQLDLKERPGRKSERIPATCLVNQAEIYGREKDKKAILELLNSESSDRRVALISIVGLGGVGKTTLAQLIFNEAGEKFDLTAWVSVGEDFDVVRLTKTVLQSVGGDLTSNDLNSHQLDLKARLSEKKFFMVLDDVWNENYDHWTIFLRPFENGANNLSSPL
ncbi:putative disease resistance RPP13-like protein 1 [Jatropha curcas]|uniref:putative disease resistance RPP13-like protein 1 n=1 Tax=Jatropha curcas TaxID=180498 RepID=UPI0018941A8D|nr:putative disease resistance RPP13-like protein 1 [Jatropha curcas]